MSLSEFHFYSFAGEYNQERYHPQRAGFVGGFFQAPARSPYIEHGVRFDTYGIAALVKGEFKEDRFGFVLRYTDEAELVAARQNIVYEYHKEGDLWVGEYKIEGTDLKGATSCKTQLINRNADYLALTSSNFLQSLIKMRRSDSGMGR